MNALKRGKRSYLNGLPKAAARRIIDSTVKRAAKKLDQEYPGWARKIKLSELEFDSCCNCVYGQLDTAYEGCKRGPGASKGVPMTFLTYEMPLTAAEAALSNKGWRRKEIVGYVVPDAAIAASGLNDGDNSDLRAYQENCWRDEIRKRARYDTPVAA